MLSPTRAGYPQPCPQARHSPARRMHGDSPVRYLTRSTTNRKPTIIRILGVRSQWNPQPVEVEVAQAAFLKREPFRQAQPLLASAFYLSDVPYRWERGVRMPMGDS